MADVDFISTTIQNYYTNTTGAAGFRTGGTDGEDGSVKSLDARIAAFEQVIIDRPPSGFTNAEFPYDKEGLKKEFLDEVLAMLLSRSTTNSATPPVTTYTYARTVTYQLENFQNDPNYVAPPVPQIELFPGFFIDDPAYVAPPVPQAWVASGSPVTISPIKDGLLMGSLQQAPALTLATQRYTITGNGAATGPIVGPTAAVTFFQPVKNFDDLDHNAVIANDQYLQLLSQGGIDVYNYYSSLIDQVFNEGDALKLVKDPHNTGEIFAENDNQTLVVTAIEPVIFDGVMYTHATSFKYLKNPPPTAPNADKYEYVVHLVEEGVETYVPMKVPIYNSNTTVPRTVVGFTMGFTDATTKATKYLPVALVNGEYVRLKDNSNVDLPAVTLDKQRNMYIDDYLYFWNEARTGILRAQLAYKEAVTREMQEDLRQANDALAELERQSALTDGNDLNKTSPETLALDLWEAKAGLADKHIFNNSGNDDIQNFSTWQESRTNLKNYIDRKSAQSQQAMLDYQTVLNRFNNAFEVMSKIQEKVDSLLKSQLRNYN